MKIEENLRFVCFYQLLWTNNQWFSFQIGSAEARYVKITDIVKATRHLFTYPSYKFVTIAICADEFMITSIPPFLPKILQSQFRFTASEASVVFGIIAGVSALGKCGTRRRGWGVGEGGAGVFLLTGNLLGKCGTRRGWGLEGWGEGDGAMGEGVYCPYLSGGMPPHFRSENPCFYIPFQTKLN